MQRVCLFVDFNDNVDIPPLSRLHNVLHTRTITHQLIILNIRHRIGGGAAVLRTNQEDLVTGHSRYQQIVKVEG